MNTITHAPPAPRLGGNATTLFAPAELDWFRHTPGRKEAPVLLAIDDGRRLAADRPWWRDLLDDLD